MTIDDTPAPLANGFEMSKPVMDTVINEVQQNVSTEYLVHAKVNFLDSPEGVLTKTDLKVLDGVLFRKDHLKRNLGKIEYGRYSTCDADGSLYDHCLDLKITVDASKL